MWLAQANEFLRGYKWKEAEKLEGASEVNSAEERREEGGER